MTTAPEATTAIGSLPHHNVDAALEWSFRMGLPFLPQIPIRNPWEFMIPQALEGLPGLSLESGGLALLNADIWRSRAQALDAKLARAFERGADPQAFEAFEPSPSVSSAWQPFVWELGERGIRAAKVQIAGPLTSQWSLQVQGDAPDLPMQVYKLTLARALSMTRKLQSEGIRPILYIDEPALYGLSRENPRHVLGLQELKLLIQTLRKEGVTVGLHCCSNTDWREILALGLDLVSIDTGLSAASLLEAREADGTLSLQGYLARGGRLSLGVVPTARASVLHSLKAESLFAELLASFAPLTRENPELVRQALSQALYTPACGLAFHTIAEAELTAEILFELEAFARLALGKGKLA